MERVRERLKIVLPLTLFLILLLLYLNTRSLAKTLIIMLAVPFSAVGAIWFLYLLGYNMSIGVWVGLIALMGVDAETGVFMLLYLDLAYDEAQPRRTPAHRSPTCGTAIMHGAVKRIRPKFMTVADDVHGPGADHVVDGRGRRRDEAHRRADDRRHLHVVPARAGGLSGHLRGLEVAFRPEARIGACAGIPRRVVMKVAAAVLDADRHWRSAVLRRGLEDVRGRDHRHDVCRRSRGDEGAPPMPNA